MLENARKKSEEKRGHIIKSVAEGSIAEEMEIEAGDRLIAIDNNEIKDILDYRYYINSEKIVVLIEKADGEVWELDIENDYEDIGLDFEEGLMSDYRSCTNDCVFCFIDQMPKGMRETLYFKDDDSRLSFLQGNYVTLTNMKDADIDRIIRFKLAPINISIHTTNPTLRVRMLHNRFAGDALRYIDKLYENGIPMNGQIVMCKGYNDGAELEATLRDLLKYAPIMESVSVVPVGLSKHRKGLAPLELIDKETAIQTIEIIEKYQKKALEKCGMHFVHASDEFYLKAERELPEESSYDGYIQLENGVGMLRLLKEEVLYAIEERLENTESVQEELQKEETISIATGKLAGGLICELAKKVEEAFPTKKVNVNIINNDFFGDNITVTGLLTGTDLIKQLKGKDLGDRLLLSVNMFRSGEEVFLDDFTKDDLEKELGVRIVIVGSSGDDFVNSILLEEYHSDLHLNPYELGEEMKEIYYE